MDQHQRDQLGIKLTQLAMLYGKDFPKEQATLFINSLISFIPDTFENYIRAISAYAEDSKNKFFPTPNSLRPYLKPEMSTDAMANEVASRIRQAITKFGWPNSKDAKEYIGNVGWTVVERSGGWLYLCENHGVELSPLTFFAQSRDLTKSLIENSKHENFNMPISIKQLDKKQLSLSDEKNEQVSKLLELLGSKELKK